MENNDRIKRAIAFYFSVALFFVLLPIVLSYSLGYHIDYKSFNIYKTGMIYLKSQPAGAYIYINGKRLLEITPARIEELKPGTYTVEVRRDGYYPWQKNLVVRPAMVTRADDIVLFPLTQEMKRVLDYEVIDFIASDKNYIYYLTNVGLFRSSMDGTNTKRLSPHSNWPKDIIGKKFSPNGEKILYFSDYTIWVLHLNLDKTLVKNGKSIKSEEILKSENPLVDVYWYSDATHIVFITNKDINVAELNSEGKRNVVTLYKFNAPPHGLYYDVNSDSLYFIDYTKGGPGSSEGSYLYRLNLRQKFFDQFMQMLQKEFDIKYE